MSASRKHVLQGSVDTKFKKQKKIVIKSEVEEIKAIAREVIKSKKNCNDILGIFQVGEVSLTEDTSLACIRAYHKVFCHYLDNGDLQKLPAEENHPDKSEVKVRQWLRERYEQSTCFLVGYIKHESTVVRELALCTLMKYVEAEGKHPIDSVVNKSSAAFPVNLFERVIASLVSNKEDNEDLLKRFQEYLEYDDIRYHYMRFIQNTIKEVQASSDNSEDKSNLETELNNILAGMLILTLPSGTDKLGNIYVSTSTVPSSISGIKSQRALYSKLWISFVKKKLTGSIYKKILISLPDKVLPYLDDPLIMSDWLVTCYDHGGAVSLMALNGLFVLMNSYNLEYPDFYNKLYNIMGNEIFSAKYKARFFHLLDLFLRSLLLPTFTVAAFIKKLSRMALTAPPQGAMLVIELIINLLVRHDTCRGLAHRDTDCDLQTDPYNAKETDMSQCRAMQSSLWEIKKHWHHSVASQARRLDKPLPHTESLLDSLLELTHEELMTKEVKKSKKTKQKELSGEVVVPVNHIPASKLLSWETSDISDLWTVQEV